MAIYVTSDAHGHVRALDEALSKISLTSDDTLYVLGDMIDRGPDPVGVIKLVRSLPNARVLKGNHEQIMLDAIIGQDPLDAETWDINGGWTTREQLNDMEFEAYEELVRWMAALPPPAPSSVAWASCGSMMGRSSTRTSTRANNRCKG